MSGFGSVRAPGLPEAVWFEAHCDCGSSSVAKQLSSALVDGMLLMGSSSRSHPPRASIFRGRSFPSLQCQVFLRATAGARKSSEPCDCRSTLLFPFCLKPECCPDCRMVEDAKRLSDEQHVVRARRRLQASQATFQALEDREETW